MKPLRNALLTDLYQLTMLQGYAREDMNATAVFEFFVRRLPRTRNFLVAAGLEQVLEFLEEFQFSPEEVKWVRDQPQFTGQFAGFLEELRFTGQVHAMPEGTVFFANEPILRVTAPLPEAQIIETRLINLLQFQTVIASKAARCLLAAPGQNLVDFGLRRAHAAEAGLLAARASYITGFQATSNVLAGKTFGIPVSGTMAHSFVQAHDSEQEAFEHFARANPDNAVLVIDTYDIEAGIRRAIDVARTLQEENINVRGVRIDSGDLAALARKIRRLLDKASLRNVSIFVSGNLSEHELAELVESDAPIDGFGVGTRMTTSGDVPYLDCAYKLQEYDGKPRWKSSAGKATLPGRKQVFRSRAKSGLFESDVLALEDDRENGEPLLIEVMQDGKRLGPSPSLEDIQQQTARQLEGLPEALRSLSSQAPYTVEISRGLHELSEQLTGGPTRLPVPPTR